MVFGGLTLAFGGVALQTTLSDPSPLAHLPSPLADVRDIPYGADPYHVMDIAYDPTDVRPRPALLMIHGGGWRVGDKAATHRLMVTYAREGYVTVSINFRPSTHARFPGPLDDCREAIRWLRRHADDYGIDPDRVGVMGWSSGAHLATMVALSSEDSERVQAVVAFAGVYDLLMEARGPFANREDDPAVVGLLGSTPRQVPDLARAASPIHHLSPDDPPLLLIHGRLDRRIDMEQAVQFGKALARLNRKDEVIILPKGDHGVDLLPADETLRQRVSRFLEQHLQRND